MRLARAASVSCMHGKEGGGMRILCGVESRAVPATQQQERGCLSTLMMVGPPPPVLAPPLVGIAVYSNLADAG